MITRAAPSAVRRSAIVRSAIFTLGLCTGMPCAVAQTTHSFTAGSGAAASGTPDLSSGNGLFGTPKSLVTPTVTVSTILVSQAGAATPDALGGANDFLATSSGNGAFTDTTGTGTLPTADSPNPIAPNGNLPVANGQEPLASDAKTKLELLLQTGVLQKSTNDGGINLDKGMTRADFAAIIATLISDDANSTSAFKDIDGTSWSTEMIAAALGTIGTLEKQTEFEPAGAVNLAVLVTLMQSMGMKNSSEEPVNWLNQAVLAALSQKMQGKDIKQIGLGDGSKLANEVLLEKIVKDSAAANVEFPYFNAGIVTPLSSWPTSLNATYNGRISGALQDNTQVGGAITMNVDFAMLPHSQPAAPGNIVFDNGKGSASFNLIHFGGYIGNAMTGTYNGEALTTGSYIKDGQFFGPAANEVGGKWTIKTNNVEGGGTFAAKR